MSEKPSPKSLSSNFMNAALAVFVGSIALYLAFQVLRSVVAPIIVTVVLAIAFMALRAWRRHVSSSTDEW